MEPYNLVSRVGCVIMGNCLHLRTCCQMVMAPREVAMTLIISISFALYLAPSVNYHLKCYVLILQDTEQLPVALKTWLRNLLVSFIKLGVQRLNAVNNLHYLRLGTLYSPLTVAQDWQKKWDPSIKVKLPHSWARSSPQPIFFPRWVWKGLEKVWTEASSIG